MDIAAVRDFPTGTVSGAASLATPEAHPGRRLMAVDCPNDYPSCGSVHEFDIIIKKRNERWMDHG